MKVSNKVLYRGVLLLGICLLVAACSRSDPGVFATPEAAMQAVSSLIGLQDEQGTEEIFGPGSADLFRSGDENADREDGERVKAMIEAGVSFEDFDENTKIALLGEDLWPWPIPLVRDGNGWRFDTEGGREEILNRRIGRNELWTLTSLHAIVDAQREYRSQSLDGKPRAYAQRFRSTAGQHDGLYWPAEDDSDISPLGDLLAGSEASGDDPQPFNGYFYRILTRQGDSAPGGAREYLDESGLMTGGFAVIAWPAKYGNSGVMTFFTSPRGMVFQKDLGAETESVVAGIDSYDPDAEWTPTGDSVTEDGSY